MPETLVIDMPSLNILSSPSSNDILLKEKELQSLTQFQVLDHLR